MTEQPDALAVELCLPAGSIANLNPMLLLDAWKNRAAQRCQPRRYPGQNCSQKKNKNFLKNTCIFFGNVV